MTNYDARPTSSGAALASFPGRFFANIERQAKKSGCKSRRGPNKMDLGTSRGRGTSAVYTWLLCHVKAKQGEGRKPVDPLVHVAAVLKW